MKVTGYKDEETVRTESMKTSNHLSSQKDRKKVGNLNDRKVVINFKDSRTLLVAAVDIRNSNRNLVL